MHQSQCPFEFSVCLCQVLDDHLFLAITPIVGLFKVTRQTKVLHSFIACYNMCEVSRDFSRVVDNRPFVPVAKDPRNEASKVL